MEVIAPGTSVETIRGLLHAGDMLILGDRDKQLRWCSMPVRSARVDTYTYFENNKKYEVGSVELSIIRIIIHAGNPNYTAPPLPLNNYSNPSLIREIYHSTISRIVEERKTYLIALLRAPAMRELPAPIRESIIREAVAMTPVFPFPRMSPPRRRPCAGAGYVADSRVQKYLGVTLQSPQ